MSLTSLVISVMFKCISLWYLDAVHEILEFGCGFMVYFGNGIVVILGCVVLAGENLRCAI